MERGDIVALHYGSTAALNVLLTRQGATIGLLTTEGFGQILHLARSQTPGPLVGWLNWVKPDPLVPLELTREVPERVRPDGTVEVPFDDDVARSAIEDLAGRGVEAIAVVFLHVRQRGARVACPCHRHRGCAGHAGHALARGTAGVPRVRTRHDGGREHLHLPVGLALAGGLRLRLRAEGLDCAVNIVRSDGGLMSSDAAAVRPVETIVSGPSGGVAGALAIATAAGFGDILTLDMGGTSADVSVCTAGEALITRDTTVGDLPVRSPSVDVRSIGAGGGSIAFVPELLRGLRVGPASAGAEPAGLLRPGGNQPTCTDATSFWAACRPACWAARSPWIATRRSEHCTGSARASG